MEKNVALSEISVPCDVLPATSAPRLARRVNDLLATADIRVGGDRPWDIRVNDPRLYRRLILGGMLGLGDAYVDQWWDCDAIDQFFDRALQNGLASRLPFDVRAATSFLLQKLWNFQRPGRSRRNAE